MTYLLAINMMYMRTDFSCIGWPFKGLYFNIM